jgi:hypothetical protein
MKIIEAAVTSAIVIGISGIGLGFATAADAASSCTVYRTSSTNGYASCAVGPGQVRVVLTCYDAVHDSFSTAYGAWVNAPSGTSYTTCAAGHGTDNYPGGVNYQTQ